MDDNKYFELILRNSKNKISYLVDIFQENTINSQDVIIGIIDDYRKKLDGLDKDIYSLVFREVKDSNDGTEEKIIKIKDKSLFYIEGGNVLLEKEISESRKITILNTINFNL